MSHGLPPILLASTLRAMNTRPFLPLVLLASLARADVLPPAQDASSLRGKLTLATGKAGTLTVSATRKGYALFNLDNVPADVQPTDIANARLRVYFTGAARPGDIAIHTVTAAWDEKTTAPEPGVSVSPVAMYPMASFVGKKFVEVDVTATVQAWRTAPATNFGFAFVATGNTSVLIGAKEGSGSGYPCELDIEIERAIPDGAIGTTQIADGAVTNMKLVTPSLTITAGTGLSGGGTVALGGNVTLSLGTNLTLGGITTGAFSGDGSALTNLNAANLGGGSVDNTELGFLDGVTASIQPQIATLTTNLATTNTNVGNLTTTVNGKVSKAGDTMTGPLTISGVTNYNNGLVLNGSADTGTGLALQNTSAGGHSYALFSGGTGIDLGAGGFGIYDETVSAYRLAITSAGNVGIGTSNPTQAKLVVNGVAGAVNYGPHGFLSTSGAGTSTGTGPSNLSISASGDVHAATFRAVSDERIKTILSRSDATTDLRTLLGIEITDYHYKDIVTKGSRPQKKVIAQQVEQVFPQAVTQSTDVVPDIYEQAEVKDGWVTLATDLKVGERVRLIGEKEEGIHEVLGVRAGAFRTAFQSATGRVFVYGREVKDFRAVDYEAIAMLNVSATQELARQVAAKDAEIAELRARLERLEQVLTKLSKEPERPYSLSRR